MHLLMILWIFLTNLVVRISTSSPYPIYVCLFHLSLFLLPFSFFPIHCPFFRRFRDRVSLQPWLVWNSLCSWGWPRTQRSKCLYLLGVSIKGMHHHYHQHHPWTTVLFSPLLYCGSISLVSPKLPQLEVICSSFVIDVIRFRPDVRTLTKVFLYSFFFLYLWVSVSCMYWGGWEILTRQEW